MEVIWTGDYVIHDVYGSMHHECIEIRIICRQKPLWKCAELGKTPRYVFFMAFSHLKSANWFYDAIKSGENIPLVVQEHPPGSVPEEQD